MTRTETYSQLHTPYDLVIIGGGATGLGAAVDAASRGYRVLLVEQYDFSKGTSSRSTKLVHGGVRYLAQGNIKLVREALRERGWLLQNAPHLASTQTFVIPVYSWWRKWFYASGLRLYDLLAGKWSLGKTEILSRQQTIEALPTINTNHLAGGILYYDGQFDDSRLCIDLATTAVHQGASLLNYCKAISFQKEAGRISGVMVQDTIDGNSYQVITKAVINATGVFTDAILQLDDTQPHRLVTPSQGIHLVVDRSFFPGPHAMMIPETDDGRVLFAVPWQQHVVLGTTDTLVDKISIEPQPLEAEITYLLQHINRYSIHRIERSNVKSMFAGLRPLVTVKGTQRTSVLSRDHTLLVSPSGLTTITGGKWTTYRKMAEDAVDHALRVAGLEKKTCTTSHLPIGNPITRAQQMEAWIQTDPSLQNLLHPLHPFTLAELRYAIHYEMAQTIEDILARRSRILFLDAQAALSCAKHVADFMAIELGKDDGWKEAQILEFKRICEGYILRN